MTAPLIQGASGIEGEKLTYASTNEKIRKFILLLLMIQMEITQITM